MKQRLKDSLTVYDILAEEYESSISGSAFYSDQRKCEHELLRHHISIRNAPVRALDIGCGSGTASRLLAELGLSVLAIDKCPSMRALAERVLSHTNADVSVLELDATEVRRLDGHFDVVVSFGSVINHMRSREDLESFVEGVSVKLAPGGIALIGVDNLISLDSVGWLLGAAGSRTGLRAELRDIAWRVAAGLRGRVYHNHWNLLSSKGVLELPLCYFPRSMLLGTFRANDLEVIDSKGCNIFPSLSPTYLASSEFDNRATSSASALRSFASWLDSKLGRSLNRIATYNVFVLQKTR